MSVKKFIQAAHIKKGALRKQLGYPAGEHIPTGLLRAIVDTPIGNKARGRTVTSLLKKRANFALNIRR